MDEILRHVSDNVNPLIINQLANSRANGKRIEIIFRKLSMPWELQVFTALMNYPSRNPEVDVVVLSKGNGMYNFFILYIL